MHQREQAHGAQRDGLAAGVRARDDERRVVVAEAHVDGHHLARSAPGGGRTAGPPRRGRGLRPDAVQLRREAGLGGPEVEPGERVERLAQVARRWPPTSADSSSRIRSSSACTAAAPRARRCPAPRRRAARRTASGRCPTASWTMPLTLRPRVGADRHDVAAVAERDDRLLERAAELRADQLVEAAAQPVVGDADAAPQAAQAGRRGVEQLARGVEAALRACCAAPAADGCAGRGRAAAAGAPRRGTWRAGRQRRASPRSRGTAARPGGRPGRPGRPTGRCRGRHRSRRPAAPGAGTAAWSVSSRPRRDDDRVGGRHEGLREAAGRGERGVLGKAGTDVRELEQGGRSGVHQRRRSAG